MLRLARGVRGVRFHRRSPSWATRQFRSTQGEGDRQGMSLHGWMRFAAICLPVATATGYSRAKAEGAQQVMGESGAAIETAPRENATGIHAAKNQPTVGEKPEPATATQSDVEANEMSAPEGSEPMGEAGAPDDQWALQPGELAPREIVMEFVEHLESPDDKARTLYIQGLYLEDNGDEEAAEIFYRWALVHTPGSARTLVRLGKMLDRVGRHQEAITLFGRSAQLNPTIAPEALARHLWKVRKDIVAAERVYQRILDTKTGPAAMCSAAEFHWRALEDVQQADRIYRKISHDHPRDVDAMFDVAVFLHTALGRTDTARVYFEKTVARLEELTVGLEMRRYRPIRLRHDTDDICRAYGDFMRATGEDEALAHQKQLHCMEISGRRKTLLRDLELAFMMRWRNMIYSWFLNRNDIRINIDPGVKYTYEL